MKDFIIYVHCYFLPGIQCQFLDPLLVDVIINEFKRYYKHNQHNYNVCQLNFFSKITSYPEYNPG